MGPPVSHHSSPLPNINHSLSRLPRTSPLHPNKPVTHQFLQLYRSNLPGMMRLNPRQSVPACHPLIPHLTPRPRIRLPPPLSLHLPPTPHAQPPSPNLPLFLLPP